jgi:transposase-like protein
MAKAFTAGKVVKAKPKCCKSRPRCKRCHVTLERLDAVGLAERVDKRHYVILELVPKRELKAARRR